MSAPHSQLAEARACIERGWAVTVLHNPQGNGCSCRHPNCDRIGKHPRLKDWQAGTRSPDEIEGLFSKYPKANLGVITGEPSGIVVLDEDPRNGADVTLDALQDKYGRLPHTVESITGGGGRHKLFRWPGFTVKNDSAGKLFGPGLDIKGDGGMIVAPPSVTKAAYEWEFSSHPADTEVAPLPPWMRDELQNAADAAPLASVYSVSSVSLLSPYLCLSVNEAIELTLPTEAGQRNRKVFEYARALQAVPGLADAALPDLREHALAWFKRALPIITTKEFDVTWADFCYAWPKVRVPLGVDSVAEAMARADREAPPAAASRYDSPTTRRLVSLCCQLQRFSGTHPFFLSCRKAAQYLGIDHVTTSKLLSMLLVDGVLSKARTHTAHQATRYRYVAEGAR